MVGCNGKIQNKAVWAAMLYLASLVMAGNAQAVAVFVTQGAGKIGEIPTNYGNANVKLGISEFDAEASPGALVKKDATGGACSEFAQPEHKRYGNIVGIPLEPLNSQAGTIIISPTGVSKWSRVLADNNTIRGTTIWHGDGSYTQIWDPKTINGNSPKRTADSDTFFWCPEIPRPQSADPNNVWNAQAPRNSNFFIGWIIYGDGLQSGEYKIPPLKFIDFAGKGGKDMDWPILEDITVKVVALSCSLIAKPNVVDFGDILVRVNRGKIADKLTTVDIACPNDGKNSYRVYLKATASGLSQPYYGSDTRKLMVDTLVGDQKPGLYIIGNIDTWPGGRTTHATCENTRSGLDFRPNVVGYFLGWVGQKATVKPSFSVPIRWTLCRGDGELETGPATATAVLSVVTR
ncbi:MAG: hypothetical protein LBI71_11945 [Enterobacteriaceae bacterium]|jgi:hypothetical protein|nr:hypothetical protein [Enterobacteriaceae bacterium]